MAAIQTTIVLDEELSKMLKEEAEREDRTVSAQIRRILKNYYHEKSNALQNETTKSNSLNI